MRRPASDRQGKDIVRLALQPGAFRDRLTRDIFVSDDPARGVGLLEATLVKVVACEEAEKKLERAIRQGTVQRFHDRDWIEEAAAKGVLTADEAKELAELRDMVERVIAVDDFAAWELKREHKAPPGDNESHPKQHMAAE